MGKITSISGGRATSTGRRSKSTPLSRHYIRDWRIHRKLTQERLAELVGLTHGAISQLETGKVAYVQDTIEIIARVLACTPADLIGRPPGTVAEIDELLRRATPYQLEQALTIIRTLVTQPDKGDRTAG